jgi:hypothetical protein
MRDHYLGPPLQFFAENIIQNLFPDVGVQRAQGIVY